MHKKSIKVFNAQKEHIFKNCKPILENLKSKFKSQNIKYEDIFCKTKKQLKAVEMFNELMKVRENLLNV